MVRSLLHPVINVISQLSTGAQQPGKPPFRPVQLSNLALPKKVEPFGHFLTINSGDLSEERMPSRLDEHYRGTFSHLDRHR
jgi:hypothetical protein